jgi:succinoglycan biosynthesis transport protein ExoP
VKVLRRRWRVVALVTACALVGTLLGLLASRDVRAATATLRAPALPDDLEYTDRLLNTYLRIAQSVPLRAKVQATHPDVRLSASAVPKTELIELTARAPTSEVAKRAANTWAEALVDRIRRDARNDVLGQRSALEAELSASERQLAALRAQLVSTTDRRERARLQERIRVGELDHQALAGQRLAPNNTQSVRNVLSIAEPATPTGGVVTTDARNLAVGLIVGLLAAVGVAFLLERRAPQLDTLDEIERAAGASVLATIPFVRGATPTVFNSGSPVQEAFGALRARLLSEDGRPASFPFAWPELEGREPISEPRSVLVTSAEEGDGKSVVAVNLAAALARARRRVLLVDADLRRPILHRVFGLDNLHGLSELLRDAHDPEPGSHIASTGIANLSVLTSGRDAAEAAELLASTRMAEVIETLELAYDFLVIDSAALASASDAAAVALYADAVLFVVARTPASERGIQRARRQLEGVGGHTVGVVVNRWSAAQSIAGGPE